MLEAFIFVLALALVIGALHVLAKIAIPLLLRALLRLYNSIPIDVCKRYGLPIYRPFASRFPRLASRIGRRFSVAHFAGLPLTLLTAIALYAAVLAIEITLELTFEPHELQNLDKLINDYLQPFRSDALVTLFGWITEFGNTVTLLALSATATAFALAGGRTVSVLPLWVTVLGTQVFTWAGKFSLDRPRPEFLTGIVAHSPSFPSAHASGSLAIYGFIAYMLARDIRSPTRRFETVFWIAVLVGLIGFSRVFLHVHYASDVVAGFLVGGFWLVVGISIAEWRRTATY
ncbi:MAG TPA: phosphatase PAP2 family protein [Woeseiaceae bacterium]|nr:phosphatase PAP2 family protein [Woeseiaceae bacterium]